MIHWGKHPDRICIYDSGELLLEVREAETALCIAQQIANKLVGDNVKPALLAADLLRLYADLSRSS